MASDDLTPDALRAENRALRTRLQEAEALLDALPDMIGRHGRDGTFLGVKAARTFRPIVPETQLMGRQPADVLPPTMARDLTDAIERAFATGEVATVELRFPDGLGERCFEARVIAIDENQAVSLVRDVSAQRDAERQLAQRDAVLERLIEAAIRINAERTLKGVLQEIADSAREVIGCRYAALGILNARGEGLENFVVSGISEERMRQIGALPVGHGVLGTLIRDAHPIRIARIEEHPDSVGVPEHHPAMHSFLGVPVIGTDGAIGNLYFTDKVDAPAFSEEDESVAVMFAANAAVAVENARLDEEAAQLLDELQRMQRSRDRFLAMISHELRNALTAVHGWAELLLRKAGDDPPRPVLETVESAEYALQLLHDLLDLSRMDAEMLPIRATDADAVTLARDAVATVEPTATEERVTLTVAPAGGPLPCRTDPGRVRQILVNLLSNAIRHSPADAEVIVEVGGTNDRLSYRVIDHGEGIGPEELAIIFDAYARAETRTGGGTGLGLTLSRRLARLLGGDLSVESQLGAGARFTLTVQRFMPS